MTLERAMRQVLAERSWTLYVCPECDRTHTTPGTCSNPEHGFRVPLSPVVVAPKEAA